MRCFTLLALLALPVLRVFFIIVLKPFGKWSIKGDSHCQYRPYCRIVVYSSIERDVGLWQWLAVIMTVAGAILISLQRNAATAKLNYINHSFYFSWLLNRRDYQHRFKYGLKTIPFWNTMASQESVPELCFGLLSAETNLLEWRHAAEAQKIGLVVGDQCIGIVSAYWLLRQWTRPVALVNALLNTRPVFLYLLLVLSRFLRILWMSSP